MSSVIGQPLTRADGHANVTGQAAYVAEFFPPGLCHAVMVPATIARGRVTAIDAAAAEAVPGVIAVFTHRQFPKLKPAPVLLQAGDNRRKPNGSAGQRRLPLQDDRVEYPGEPVAVVLADSFDAAGHAAGLVRVAYAPEPPRVDLEAERQAAFAPKDVWGEPPDYARGDVATAVATAAVRVDRTYHTPVQHHVTMEPHAAMASWDAPGKLTLHQTTTWVGGGRKTVAAWFGVPEADVRVVNRFVGGSFGSKGPTWPHVAVCVGAARVVGRPVRLALSRQQTFYDAGRRPQLRHDVRLAADADGRLTAFVYNTTAETAVFDDRVVAPTVRTPPRLYACPNVATSYRLVHLNRNGPFTMRGPGETPGLFALESAMDELAVALKLDPVELRLRNHAAEDPTEKQPWSSKHLRECYQQAAERFGWARRTPEPRSMRAGDELIGWGMASMIYDARSAAAEATASLYPDGSVVLRSATVDPGTGQYTILPQIAADALGTTPDRVRIDLGDTDLPTAPLVAGSQTTATVGTAVAAAAADLRRRLVKLAISTRGSPLDDLAAADVVVDPGVLRAAAAPARSLTFSELMRLAGERELRGTGKATPIEETKDVSRFSFGAHFAEVRVRPATGEVRVSRYVAAFAAGRIINPLTARSQLVGGIVWGIGQALHEATHVCPATGRYVNHDLGEYHVPTNADVPPIDAWFVDERDDRVNPLGVKGVGEIGTIGSAPAIANAVYHATGKRVRELPITPDKLMG
jgi:xanthine dehydrogenase YagR molybdenum-binding subunit